LIYIVLKCSGSKAGTGKEPLAPTIAAMCSHSNLAIAATAADVIHTVSSHTFSFLSLVDTNPDLPAQVLLPVLIFRTEIVLTVF
jgi:hypothetical protein